MSLSEHERLYTPSYWSKRYGNMELLAHFFKLSTEVTSHARKTTRHELNVSYGATEGTKYDIYGTDLPDDAPIFLYIHGGYWQEMSKDISAHPVSSLVAEGIKVAIAGYDLCPKVKVGDIVCQVKRATEEILSVARNIGSRCVWVGGHSAGAHLAASLLDDPQWLGDQGRLLKGLVLISGIYNLEPLLDTSFNDALKMTRDEAKALSVGSVESREPINDLQVIVAVGECDSPIFVQESRQVAKNLVDIVDRVEYVLLRKGTDHFDIVEQLADKTFILTKLIVQSIRSS